MFSLFHITLPTKHTVKNLIFYLFCQFDSGGLVTKSCLTLETLWTVACQAPLSMGFLEKNTRVDCHFLLQGIIPTQGLNPGLLHCRQIFNQLSYEGSPCQFDGTGSISCISLIMKLNIYS